MPLPPLRSYRGILIPAGDAFRGNRDQFGPPEQKTTTGILHKN